MPHFPCLVQSLRMADISTGIISLILGIVKITKDGEKELILIGLLSLIVVTLGVSLLGSFLLSKRRAYPPVHLAVRISLACSVGNCGRRHRRSRPFRLVIDMLSYR